MTTFKRLLRHLCTTGRAGRRAFPPATLQAIEATIAAGETRHRAELRLIIEPALDLQDVLNGVSARDRARELFAQYGIWDTEDNCGVLVYINLADHQVEIVADRGVGRVVPPAAWQHACRTMTEGYARNDYHGSTLSALAELEALLEQHYPDDGSTRNQLADKPVML